MLRIAFGNIYSKPLDLPENFKRAEDCIKRAKLRGADLVVFPQGALSGAELGLLGKDDHFGGERDFFISSYNALVEKLSEDNPDIYILTDYRVMGDDRGEFFCQLYYGGRDIDWDSEMAINGVTIKVLEEKSQLEDVSEGYDCFILMDQDPVLAGERYLLHERMRKVADASGAAVLAHMSGWGYTSHPDMYMPCAAFIKGDRDLFTRDIWEYRELAEIFEVEHRESGGFTNPLEPGCLEFPVRYTQNPMIPANVPEEEYCLDLFRLQSAALAVRLKNLGLENAVVALSGGLDSSTALLVTIHAFDMAGFDRKGIHAVSMPGFGTSRTTKSLAQKLAESLDIEFRQIDITAACTQALLDIGHDRKTPDVTLENVQARMRTLNALNLANMLGGIMVGTGDLSEEAMGFSTYGGDRLASYNVNSSVSKTVMRAMLPYVTKMESLAPAAPIIDEILNIPVSPELVPHGGEILQKTEDILAPYKLIDFYTYCLLIGCLSPREMADKAEEVFGGEFSREYLNEKCYMYFRKFISGAFKRSRAPEGAILTHVHLSASYRGIPSDRSPLAFKRMLEGWIY